MVETVPESRAECGWRQWRSITYHEVWLSATLAAWTHMRADTACMWRGRVEPLATCLLYAYNVQYSEIVDVICIELGY